MVRVEAGVRLIASVLLGVGLLGAASALSGKAQAAMAPYNVAEELQIAAKECRECEKACREMLKHVEHAA